MEITREDIRAAITELLGEGFQTAVDDGGDIDPITSQRELLRHSALVLLRNPDSLFYLASMFRDTLLETVSDFVDELTEAVSAIGYLISDIQHPNTAPVDAAIGYLGRLSSALSNGQNSPVARQNAASSMAEYAEEVKSRVLSGAEVKLSAAAAKATLSSAVGTIQTKVTSILESVSTLIEADIDIATLEKVYLAVTVDKMIELLSTKKEAVEAAFDAEIKDFYAFLRASENVLTVGDRYPSPTDLRFSGTAQPANSVALPAVTVQPATLTGSKFLPIVVTPANKTLTVRFNGTPYVVTLIESEEAEVVGVKTTPFEIVSFTQATITGTTAAPFTFAGPELWRVYVDGVYFEGTLAAGVYATVAAIVAEITLKVSHPVAGGVAGWLAMTDVGGSLKLAYNHAGGTVGDHRIILGSYTTANGILGFTDGQDSDNIADPQVTQGVDGNDELKLVVDSYAEQTVMLTTGNRNATQVGWDIDAAITGVSSGDDGTGKVYILSDTLGDGARVLVSGGTTPDVLGLYNTQLGKSAHKKPSEILEDVNNQISGGTATTTLTALSTGVCNTVVGLGNEDLIDLPAGEGTNVNIDDIIILQTGENAGAYTITNVAVDRITVDRDQRETAGPVAQKYTVIQQPVVFTSTKIDALDSSIQTTAATLFGFPVTTVYGSVSDVAIIGDFRYVRPGDVMTMGGAYTISSILSSSSRFVVTPLVAMNAGSAAATVQSIDAIYFTDMVDALEAWKAAVEAAYPNFNALNVTAAKVLVTPSAANRTAMTNALNSLLAYFSGIGSLTEILEDFVCRRLSVVDRLLHTLEERGSARGAALLKNLDFSSFFDFDARLSYGLEAFDQLAALLRTHAPVEAVREVVEDELIEASEVVDVDMPETDDDIELPEVSFLDVEEDLEW